MTRELTLCELAQKALSTGMSFGFNAARVVHFTDSETLEDLLEFTWGDREKIFLPRVGIEGAALAYSSEIACTRTPVKQKFRPYLAAESARQLGIVFAGTLLELQS